jgi:hypothetical protein
MFFSRPIQWYHSHADPIWPDSTLAWHEINALRRIILLRITFSLSSKKGQKLSIFGNTSASSKDTLRI